MKRALQETQSAHEESIDRLAKKCRERDEEATRQRQQLEQHYEALLSELNLRTKVCSSNHWFLIQELTETSNPYLIKKVKVTLIHMLPSEVLLDLISTETSFFVTTRKPSTCTMKRCRSYRRLTVLLKSCKDNVLICVVKIAPLNRWVLRKRANLYTAISGLPGHPNAIIYSLDVNGLELLGTPRVSNFKFDMSLEIILNLMDRESI